MHNIEVTQMIMISGGITEAKKDSILGILCAGGVILGASILGGATGGLGFAFAVSVGLHSCGLAIIRNS